MVDDAVKIGHVLAPAGDVVPEARDVQPSEDGVIMVDLPDGTKARLRAPNVPVQS
jgi:hypothetical protein